VAGRIATKPGEPACAAVIADWSVAAKSPRFWAERAVAAYHTHEADRLVAEVNQGGDLVEEIVRQVDPDIAYHAVRANRGKVVRAEPVAALYEQGRVCHLRRDLSTLEDQMCAFGGERSPDQTRSPDRVDALVWAITTLLLSKEAAPAVRKL